MDVDPNVFAQRYKPEAWLDDLCFLCGSVTGLPRQERTPAFECYYHQHHPGDPHATDNIYRIVAAYNYLIKNLDRLEIGEGAVVGQDAAIVSEHFGMALYRLFMAMPVSQLYKDFDVAVLLKMAVEQRGLNQ